jgi:lysozyme
MIEPPLRAELLRLGFLTAAQLDLAIANVTPKPAAATPRKIGPRALALIHHFESCRLKAYRCPAGVPTIGWGNTFYASGRPVQMGDTITQATADELFRVVLAQFERGVDSVGLFSTPAQFGAMVSLAYNIGLGWAFGKPKPGPRAKMGFNQSAVLRHHRAGEHQEAADAFGSWRNAGGKVSPGLVRRRAAERLLYLNDLPAFDKAIGYKP